MPEDTCLYYIKEVSFSCHVSTSRYKFIDQRESSILKLIDFYLVTWQEKKSFNLSSSLLETSENLLLILQYKTPKVSLLCCSIVQKYGEESCWELTICVLQQTSINNDQIIWCLCVLAMGDLFSDCHSKLWHYRVRTIVCKPRNNGAKIFMKLHLLLFINTGGINAMVDSDQES